MTLTILSKPLAKETEQTCIKWGGEFRGEICLSLKIDETSVELCIKGEARRIGKFEECFDLVNACYTILDVGVGKLKFCISNIEWRGDLPRCLTVKLKLDSWLGDATLLREKLCLFAVAASDVDEPFAVNADASRDELVGVLVVDQEIASDGCNC